MNSIDRGASPHRCLLLKCDDPAPDVVARHGDFAAWFGSAIGALAEIVAVDVRNAPLSSLSLDPFSSILVSGSSHSAYGNEPWLSALESLIRSAVADRRLPLLGVCFGHQMLARAFGGKVARSSCGGEVGTIEIVLNREGRADPLFCGLGDRFFVQALHGDTICGLPEGARLLASSARDSCQAFALGPAWGIQFHPEVAADMLAGYIRENATRLRERAFDPDELLLGLRSTKSGHEVLRNFIRTANRLACGPRHRGSFS